MWFLLHPHVVLIVVGTMVAAPASSAPMQNPWNQNRYWHSYEDLSLEDYGIRMTRPSSGYNAHNMRRAIPPTRQWLNSVEDDSWEYGFFDPVNGDAAGYKIGYGYDASYEDILEYQYLKQLLGAGDLPGTRGTAGTSKGKRNDRIPTIH